MTNWSEYSNKKTSELVELIKMRDQASHIEQAQAAFHAFYFRFTPVITKESEIVCDKWGLSKEDAITIVERTFKRFWQYGRKFDISKSSSSDYETAVILYLNRIARNVRVDYYNEKNGISGTPYTGNETIFDDLPELHEHFDYGVIQEAPTHSEVVKKALSQLSEKHRIIYLNYSAYQQNGYKMPRKLLASLRKKLELKQATIQSYKKECLDKINEYKRIYGID